MSKPTLEDSAKSSEQPVKTERWFVNFNKTFGPIATEQVRNLVRKGILRVDTPIRMDGESKWIVLAQSTVMEGLDPVAVSDAGSGSDIPNPNANGKSNVFKWVFALFMIGAPVGVHQYWQREVHKINSDLDEQKSSLVVKDQMLETQKVEIERLRAELEEARKKEYLSQSLTQSEPTKVVNVEPSPPINMTPKPQIKAQIERVQISQPRVTYTHKIKEMKGSNEIDILWVIDNSESMEDDHQNLIRNTEKFMGEFSKNKSVDWKMGLLSTDEDDDPYLGFEEAPQLTVGVAEPIPVFQAAVKALGIKGSGHEKSFGPVLAAFDRFPSFLRKGAHLALIFVTDAREQTKDLYPDAFWKRLADLKGMDKILLYGVFGAEDFGCTENGGETKWKYAGSRFEELFKSGKGKTFPLCTQDFGQQLSEVGKDLVKEVKQTRIRLSSVPKVGTVKVSYAGKDLPSGPKLKGGLWEYRTSSNSIVFHDLEFAPKENAVVSVSYLEKK